jgi:carbon-monoxide dehydrogenase small subunit
VKQLIELSVNGEVYELAVEPQTTLLEVLRDLSCLTLAVDYPNKEIITIEGLSQGEELTPVQQAFVDCGAVQCGFCTPGMILSASALLKKNPSPSEEEIRKALEGHLCRCTGYNKIVEAVNTAARQMVTKR